MAKIIDLAEKRAQREREKEKWMAEQIPPRDESPWGEIVRRQLQTLRALRAEANAAEIAAALITRQPG